MQKLLFIGLLTAGILVWGSSIVRGSDDFLIIVSSDNPTESMTRKTVSDLFLKKQQNWDHGSAVEPVDQPRSASVRAKFSETIHGRPTNAIEAYWQQKVFAGRGVPPVKEKSDAAVVEHVESNPGAIGYVSSDAPIGRCKVIEIRD